MENSLFLRVFLEEKWSKIKVQYWSGLPRFATIAISINAGGWGTTRSSVPVDTSAADVNVVIGGDCTVWNFPLVKWGAIFFILSIFRWVAVVCGGLVILGSSWTANFILDRSGDGATDRHFSLSKRELDFGWHRSSDRGLFFSSSHTRISRCETHMNFNFLTLSVWTHQFPLSSGILGATVVHSERLNSTFFKGEASIAISKNSLKGSWFLI